MADHDHGVVWPPAKGQECELPFMAMVNKEKDGLNPGRKDFKGEVNGIMIGYQGHVPRARDKIGGCPLGAVPGRPGAPSLSNDPGYVQSSKSVKGQPEHPLFISEGHDPQCKMTFKPGQRLHAAMDPSDTYKGGVPPGYAGHVHGSRFLVGQSVYSTADTYPDDREEFSRRSTKGASDALSSIYGNGCGGRAVTTRAIRLCLTSEEMVDGRRRITAEESVLLRVKEATGVVGSV